MKCRAVIPAVLNLRSVLTQCYCNFSLKEPLLTNSSVGIATGYGLEDGGVRVPVGKEFSFLHVQTDPGVHPTSYTMGNGVSFPGVKRPGREAEHSPSTSVEVKAMWVYTSTSPYVFMA
jgi:hypothetical protein